MLAASGIVGQPDAGPSACGGPPARSGPPAQDGWPACAGGYNYVTDASSNPCVPNRTTPETAANTNGTWRFFQTMATDPARPFDRAPQLRGAPAVAPALEG